MKKIYILLSLLLFSAVVLNSAIIIVPDDYFDIQMAIVAAGDGDTIVLRPGNYAANSLSWSNKHLTIRALQLNDPESYKLYGSENCFMLSGLSITNEDKILGITIEDYHAQSNWAQCGVAFNISAGASPYVEGCIIRYNSSYYLGNEQFPSNSRGIAVFCDGDAVFKNCYFYCNEGFRMIGGAALACKGNVKINDCIFENNHFIEDFCPLPYIYHDSECRNGSAILVMAAQSDEDCIEITNCKFILNDSGPGESCIFIENSTNFSTNNVEVNNCTFDQNTGNNVIEIDDALICIIKNNCFMNNESTYCVRKNQLTSSPVSYCLSYQSGNLGNFTGCINCLENTAPQLDTNYKPLWNATTKSPCIDAGDPSILDADGTPSDIGAVSAVEHKIDSVPLIQMSSGINWKCFPVIDDIYSNSDVAGNFFDDIMQPGNPSLYMVETENNEDIYWNYDYWTNYDQVIESVKGYKVYMNTSYTMEISGFLEDPSTVISLHSGENWIGYFLEDSMKPLDALASVLDDIDEIQTKTFTMEKTALGWLSSDKWTLNYGDLVIVNCTTPCNFYWGENGGGVSETTIKSDAETFSYSEEADYIPVYVELDSQSRSNPVEIGLFVDGVCKGAEVITGSTVQIRAYVTGDSTAFDPGTVSFQLNYGERGENETISDYRIKTTINDHGSVRPLDFSENTSRYYIVSFEDVNGNTPEVTQVSLNQNYPNPFNPTTTISYALVKEDDVELTVYNTKGQKVKTLVNGSTAAGEHSVEWNGTDDTNAKVSSGLYFYRLKTTDKTINRKMVLLK